MIPQRWVRNRLWGEAMGKGNEAILNRDHNRPACESKAFTIHPHTRSGLFDEGAPMNPANGYFTEKH
ncbi:hypothetical protein BS47DRAFT_1335180 [Hydnum rufescens UP504]|uniref:Uncharacterized protein n=1 Tax=Hydnum rufescens UP504 TaxID=1448309 RepID=A0A9P6E0V6_9AGAM|nr:hypothetical protein BS47DRAFT_1335173 [Hydnum rufescens UP504]KAF9521092.1 hypothetical protein BS47DRAFT_1335180 [Hydnum rufescens UP504]